MNNFLNLTKLQNNKAKNITTPALGIFKPNVNSLISIMNRIIGVLLVIIVIISLLIISKYVNINYIIGVDIIEIKKDNNFLIDISENNIKINNIVYLFLIQILLCLVLYHYFYSWIKVESNINNKQNLINKNVLKINKYYIIILLILSICIVSILWIILNNSYIFNDIFNAILVLNSTLLIYIYLIK